jgi:hypothetical protein
MNGKKRNLKILGETKMKRLLTICAAVAFVLALSALAQAPPPTEVDVDIKPQSCPNPLNVKSKGVLPVAILGSAELDVTDVNIASIMLEGEYIIPESNDVCDVTQPVPSPGDCNCTELGPDGYDDLVFNFDRQDILAAIAPVSDGDEPVLTLEAKLNDETPIGGQDCVLIIKRGKQD